MKTNSSLCFVALMCARFSNAPLKSSSLLSQDGMKGKVRVFPGLQTFAEYVPLPERDANAAGSLRILSKFPKLNLKAELG